MPNPIKNTKAISDDYYRKEKIKRKTIINQIIDPSILYQLVEEPKRHI